MKTDDARCVSAEASAPATVTPPASRSRRPSPNRRRTRTDRSVQMRRVRMALPWLVACVHASSWADPMRPLIPPVSAASASTAVAVPSRAGKPSEGEAPREPERLIAIRQDSAARWQALFGERWVGPGDKLERYTIAAIDANSVQLAEGRAKKTLYLLPPLLRPGPAVALAPSGPSPPGKPISRSPDPSKTPDLAQARRAALSPERALGLPTP